MNNRQIRAILLILFSMGMFILSYAQDNLSLASKSFLNDIKPYKINDSYVITDADIINKYALYKFDGGLYVSGLAKISGQDVAKILREKGCIINTQFNDIISIRIPLNQLSDVLGTKGLVYLELGRKVKPHLKDVLVDTRADSVHAGINLPQSYSGKGVVLGVTDWGFDYTHPTFYDTAMTQLRIVRAWDQYKLSGPAPQGFTYGTEFSTEQELLTAEHDTSNIYNLSTHGTHTSSIAAGTGAGTAYKGFAYESELVLVTILVDEASVLDAFNYIYNYASSNGKPCVVNMSWGLYYMGTMDGNSLISQALDYLSDMGMTFVSSAGNNGDVDFHVKKDFTQQDTLRTFVTFDSYGYYPSMWGQSVSMWGSANTSFQYGLEIYDVDYNLISDLPIYLTSDNTILDTNIVIVNDTITYKIECTSSNLHNQRPGVRLRVRNLKTNLYKIAVKVIADTATVHLWNIIELINDVGNWGSSFTAPIPNTQAGDPNYGIGEPACAQSVIAVGSYRAQVTLPNGNLYYGNISPFSSKGPLINGNMKPDITAPGSSVGSAISSFYNGGTVSSIANVNFNGKTYTFGRLSGTSMSGPAVAGIAALLLEINPTLTHNQLETLIKETARQDSYTGVITSAGNTLWGWGKANAYHAARLASGMSYMTDYSKNKDMTLYPNPSTAAIKIIDIEDGIYVLKIFDVTGKMVYMLKDVSISDSCTLNLNLLKRGLYTLSLENEDRRYIKKIILN